MIILTGSAGFVGSHVTTALQDEGIPWLRVDPRDPQALTLDEAIKHSIDGVIHCGAISDTTCDDYDALYNNNVALSLRLASICAVKRAPFIYCSSASVYGNNGSGPLNKYAQSKQEFDDIIESGGTDAQHWYGLRLHNVYGSGEEHKGKQASMVSQIIGKLRDRAPVTLFEERIQAPWRRDFVHVDDVVSVMLWLWKNRPASGIYDVGTGIAEPFEAIPMAIAKATGQNITLARIPFPESLKGKYQFNTCARLEKLRAAGYDKPFLSLEDGIARMLA